MKIDIFTSFCGILYMLIQNLMDSLCNVNIEQSKLLAFDFRGCRGRDHMVVGFTTTCDRSVVFFGCSGFLHQ
jgi:hypothetical protein